MAPVVGIAAQLVVGTIISAVAGGIVQTIGKLTSGQRKVSQPNKAAGSGGQIGAAPDLLTSPLSNSTDPNGPQIGIFGRGRVGGRITLSAQASDLKTYKCLVVAGAPVTVNAIYLNNGLIARDGSGNVTTSPWKLTGKTSSYTINIFNGTQVAASTVLKAAFPQWTNAMIGLKQTYLQCTINPAVDAAYAAVYQSGDPDITFDVSGFPAYDPRDVTQDVNNPATWKFTKNAALIGAGYLMHELGRGLAATDINWPRFAAAADICDQQVALASGLFENRYECFLVWKTSERHEDVLQRVEDAMAGKIYQIGGQYVADAGFFDDTGAVSIFADDYAGDGISFADSNPIDSICNGVRGQFCSPSNNYEMRDYPAYQDAAALAEDGGLDYWLDVDFPAVTSPSQAQRLARIKYLQARRGYQASVELKFKLFDTVRGDVVKITDALAQLDGASFRVEADKLAGDDYVITLELSKDDAGNYVWSASDEQPMPAPIDLSSAGGIGVNPDDLGPLQPPGFEVTPFPSYAQSNVQFRVTFRASPSARATHYVVVVRTGEYNLTTSGGSINYPAADQPAATIAKATASYDSTMADHDFQTTRSIAGKNFNPTPGWNARIASTLKVTVYALVQATSEASSSQVVNAGSVQFATIASAPYNSVTTTPLYVLAPPPAPQIASVGAGAASVNFFASSSPRATDILLYEAATNSVATATLINTAANASGSKAVTGTPGQTKYYWTRAKNSGDGNFSPFSNVLLVGF